MRVSLSAVAVLFIGCGEVASTPLMVSIEVTPEGSVPLGATQQFTATATFDDDSTSDVTAQVTWSSSDTGVATIDAAGLATSHTVGSADITATLGELSDLASLQVTDAEIASLRVVPEDAVVIIDTAQPFRAVAVYSDGAEVDVTDQAAWSSSEETVATMSGTAGEEGLAVAVFGGSSTITASFDGQSDSSDVTVPDPAIGTHRLYPGLTCTDLLANNAALATGLYWIDTDGDDDASDSFQVWCDMQTDGGGWTLLSWSGNVATDRGNPYPGHFVCATQDCLRGSAAASEQVGELIHLSTEFGKGHSAGTTANHFNRLSDYTEAARYIYGDMSTINLVYGPSSCTTTGQLAGAVRVISGPPTQNGKQTFISTNLHYISGTWDFTTEAGSYYWNVGVPNNACDSSAAMPGTWTGTASSTDYGPNSVLATGATSIWVRGGTAPPLGSVSSAPGQSCADILAQGGSYGDGTYWISSGGPAFQAYCDMTFNGGGWTNLNFALNRVILQNNIYVQCATLTQTATSVTCDTPFFNGSATGWLYIYFCDGSDVSGQYILDHMGPIIGHQAFTAVGGWTGYSKLHDGTPVNSVSEEEYCYVNGAQVLYTNPACSAYNLGAGSCVVGIFTLNH